MNAKEKKLLEQFEAETGKHAIWRGKITKNFLDWKKRQVKKSANIQSAKTISYDLGLSEIQLNFKKIFLMLNAFEDRLKLLEDKASIIKKEIPKDISDDHFFRILKMAYNSSEKRFGDFVLVSALTKKIKEYIPWSTEKLHTEIYKLFIDYKIDLQPGKIIEGVPLIQDGKTFVWFKFR